MAKLFLSYSRKDEARARRFTEWLEREGHDVWRDEDDIGGGASFSSEIENALNECGAVLALWSAESVKSAWVRDEAGYGRDRGKLIPFSLDGTEPPLGFRQFQSVDLSKWKGRGDPPSTERIKQAIERIAGCQNSAASAARSAPRDRRSRSELRRAVLIAGLLVIVAAAAVGVFLWQRPAAGGGITIAIGASPTSPNRAMAADYANVTAADMGSFLPMHFDKATVIAPTDAATPTSAYRMLISANRHGTGADASLTLSDTDGSTIIWSKSWSVPDTSAVDLPQLVSRFASQGALCLTEARGGKAQLVQPALGIFVNGCAGIGDSDRSDSELLAAFERVVKLAPDFPQGWAYVSIGRAFFAQSQAETPAYARAVHNTREAIAIARKLNPSSGLPYLAEALLEPNNHMRSLKLMDKAVELEPDNALLQMNRSGGFLGVGRMTDAVAAAKRAVELDPLAAFVRSSYISTLAYAGQLSRARADIADARKKWPNDAQIDEAEFAFQFRYGDPRAAEKLIPRVLNYSDAQLIPYRALIAARLDPTPTKIDAAIEGFRAAQGRSPRDRNRELLALGLFGKIDEVYRLLFDPGFQAIVDTNILFRPEFASVRSDPRFIAVSARLGLVRYWRENGNWPDFCTSEQLRYDCKAEAQKYPN